MEKIRQSLENQKMKREKSDSDNSDASDRPIQEINSKIPFIPDNVNMLITPSSQSQQQTNHSLLSRKNKANLKDNNVPRDHDRLRKHRLGAKDAIEYSILTEPKENRDFKIVPGEL